MPAAKGSTKPTLADTSPSNAASSSTIQNGSLFPNLQTSSTSQKFSTPSTFDYGPNRKQSGVTPGNAGSSSTARNESLFSKPPSFGDIPKFGAPSIFGSYSERNQTHTPPPSNLFSPPSSFKQVPRFDIGSKGPSTGTPRQSSS